MDTTTFNGSFFLSVGGLFISFIGILFYNLRRSRCKECEVCYGLFKCERELMSQEELEADIK